MYSFSITCEKGLLPVFPKGRLDALKNTDNFTLEIRSAHYQGIMKFSLSELASLSSMKKSELAGYPFLYKDRRKI